MHWRRCSISDVFTTRFVAIHDLALWCARCAEPRSIAEETDIDIGYAHTFSLRRALSLCQARHLLFVVGAPLFFFVASISDTLTQDASPCDVHLTADRRCPQVVVFVDPG